MTLFRLTDNLTISFEADAAGSAFVCLVCVMFAVVGIYALKMKNYQQHTKRFAVFYLLTWAMLIALGFAANYLTMYMAFEFMTLLSMPLVLHDGTPEAIAAAKKYLFYSVFGATLGLFGLIYTLNYDPAETGGSTYLWAAFLSVAGFGVKAGLFPFQSWLPVAHPVAPASASAVLSGVITKGGVLCIIRVIFFEFGADNLRGTWVQTAWIVLALTTVVLGSAMATTKDVLKERLAYSTVSQVSYVLFGLFTLHPVGIAGALLHAVYHSVIKDMLFMASGAIKTFTHKPKVSELRGIGRQMPVTMTAFTLGSLGLVGIPPLAGFLSKYYIAMGALDAGIGKFGWIGPAVLLLSALLTALYLFPICINGFFPGEGFECERIKEPKQMCIALLIAAALVVILGVIPNPLLKVLLIISSELV